MKSNRDELIQRLSKLESAIDNAIENGSSYSLQGSHSKTNISIDKLEKMAQKIRLKIAVLDGLNTTTTTTYR